MAKTFQEIVNNLSGIDDGVEIQKRNDDDHQKRVRYNMANIDTSESEKGVNYHHL